jgi:solute carrier family 6 amino acid transporter-like protein 5/7/9/14
MLTLVDHFGGTFLIFTLAVLQIVCIVAFYGLENLCWDIEFMLGRHVSMYWRLSWGLITPGIMVVIFFYSMATLQSPTYGIYEFPQEYIAAGWLIFAVGASQVIIWAVWEISQKYNKISEDYITPSLSLAVQKGFTPSSEWGPKNNKQREEWIRYKTEAKEKRDLMIQIENHSKIQQIFYTFTGKYRNI